MELKEAKLASMQQQQQHAHHNSGEVTSGGGDIPLDNDNQSLDSNLTDFSNQFAHEVSKMRSWLGTNGCAAARTTRHLLVFSLSVRRSPCFLL